MVTTHYMDEAEYCDRVGIMRNGLLLAMDTPSALKQSALPGYAWDVVLAEGDSSRLLPALAALEHCPCVLRAGLAGDHLRAITPAGVEAQELQTQLSQAGIDLVQVERVEPTLEDVFLALAATRGNVATN